MNFDKVLNLLLSVADYPQEKRDEFIETSNRYFSMRVMQAVKEEDGESFKKLQNVRKMGDLSGFEKVFQEICRNPIIKKRVDSTSESVCVELIDDILVSATDIQKQKILGALPNLN